MLKRLLFAVLLLVAFACQAAVYSVPWGPKPQFVDANGAPMSNGTLQTFAGGSTTPQVTYTDSTGGVANPTTITLNVRGETPNEVWMLGGQTYKFVLKDSSGSTVWTVDNVSGVNDVTSALDEWKAGPAPTFVSTTSFTLAGDQTVTFHVGRRVRTTNSGGTIYSTIRGSVFGASTTVTVANDSGNLDAGLSAVSYGLISATNTSEPLRPFDVRAFGAKCDNASNDLVAFNAALTAATGGVAVVPPGVTCKLGNTITIPAGTTLLLDNSNITVTNAAATGEISIGGQGASVIGRGAATITCVSIQCIYSAGAINVDRLLVEGVRVISSPAGTGHCVHLGNTGTANDVTIRNNRFDACKYGVLINDAMSQANNQVVTGNRFYAIYADAIEFNRPTVGSTRVLVAGNYIEMDPIGSGGAGSGFAVGADHTSYVTIEDNIVGATRREAIHLEGELANGNDYLNVRGNIMTCVMDCIQIQGAGSYASITANTLLGNAAAGMRGIQFPDTTNYGQRVMANNIIKNFDEGILLGANSTQAVITGNYIQGGTNCLSISAGRGDRIEDNVFDGCSVGVKTAAGGIIGHNTFEGVTTLASTAGVSVTLRGVTRRFLNVAMGAGVNTAQVVMPAGSRLEGKARFVWAGAGANYVTRKSVIKWTGAAFTDTNDYNLDTGALAGQPFQKTAANIEAVVFAAGAATAQIAFEFEGDLVLP